MGVVNGALTILLIDTINGIHISRLHVFESFVLIVLTGEYLESRTAPIMDRSILVCALRAAARSLCSFVLTAEELTMNVRT